MKLFALRLKDSKELLKSSSGGAFTALSDYIIDSGGAIVSAVYNYETNYTEFSLYTKKEDRDKARGSKYMQAKPLNVFNEALKWITTNDGQLLFVGMGCQADGFRKFVELKGIRERTIIVDSVCHGAPSPKVWIDYLSHKIDFLSFKDKRDGWMHPYAYYLKDGKETKIDDYVSLFYNRCILRPSCHSCPYSRLYRKTDITIGDFWGINETHSDFYSPNGNSIVLIHSEKGLNLFERIKDRIEWIEAVETDCIDPSLHRPTPVSSRREEFWRDYQKKGISFVLKKYTGTSFMNKVIHKVTKIITFRS